MYNYINPAEHRSAARSQLQNEKRDAIITITATIIITTAHVYVPLIFRKGKFSIKMSKVTGDCFGLALLRRMIGLESSRHFLSQSRLGHLRFPALRFNFIPPHDWSRKLSQRSQPIRFKTHLNRDWVTCVFSRFRKLF